MSPEDIKKVLENHALWLRRDGGERANLSGANLYGANLRSANLDGAYLSGANLSSADLRSANLYGANLSGANLYGANLSSADLRSANLYGAGLYGADLDEFTQFGPRQWLPEGTIRLYKKVYSNGGEYILALRIDDNVARTSSYVGRKCRAASAFVESATAKDGSPTDIEVFMSGHDNSFEYRVGTTVTPDSYDPNPLVECTHGIHGFVTRQEAVDY